jgi:hypothetical protein
MKKINVKDNFIIKASFKVINEHDGVDKIYFVLADGSVIFVDGTSLMANPSNKILSNLRYDILKYGGICSCGELIIGKQSNNKINWDFSCIKCSYKISYSDNKLDEFVYNQLLKIEEDSKFE